MNNTAKEYQFNRKACQRIGLLIPLILSPFISFGPLNFFLIALAYYRGYQNIPASFYAIDIEGIQVIILMVMMTVFFWLFGLWIYPKYKALTISEISDNSVTISGLTTGGHKNVRLIPRKDITKVKYHRIFGAYELKLELSNKKYTADVALDPEVIKKFLDDLGSYDSLSEKKKDKLTRAIEKKTSKRKYE
jgi:hypothetical protein